MKRLLILSIVILSMCLQSPAFARPKFYYYDGDIPMIDFMLNMMVAMGLIDKVPPGYLNQSYGRYPYSSSGPWRGGYSSVPGMSPWNRHGREGLKWGGWESPLDHPYLQQGIDCDSNGCYRYSALDGAWMDSEGEILGIRSNQMVWSDGEDAYAAGYIRITPEYIYARLNGASTSTPYSYRLAGNQLNLRDADGSVRRFYRLPGSNKRYNYRYR